MTNKKATPDMIDELFQTLLELETVEDCKLFFDDLCTFKEVEQMAQRLRAAKLLMEGKTYAQIMNEVETSSATLSRISRCVQYGGGYSKFLRNK